MASTSPMPLAAGVARSACSEEKLMPSRPRASISRSLSLAVTAAVFTPAFDMAARMVPQRMSEPSVIMRSSPVARSR